MEAGERELRKAFEEVTTRNVTTMIEFSKNTRTIVRQLEDQVSNLQNKMIEQNKIIDNLKVQLASIQTKVYSGGS